MRYSVEFSKRALKCIKTLDNAIAALILGWIRKNLKECENPRAFAKGLTASHSGKWRYSVGNYRLLAEIQDGRLIMPMLTIGHRSEVHQ
jgi:mRNA interferase RelE/StbE